MAKKPFEATCVLNKEKWGWKGEATHEKQAKAILVAEIARVLNLSVRPYVTYLDAKEIPKADIYALGSYIDVRKIPRSKKQVAQLEQLRLF